MINYFTKLILILLLVVTPIAFGSMDLWAFSIMELGILLIICLWAIQWVLKAIGERRWVPLWFCL